MAVSATTFFWRTVFPVRAALASAVSSMEGGPAYYNTTAISLQAYAQEAAQQATKIAVAVQKM